MFAELGRPIRWRLHSSVWRRWRGSARNWRVHDSWCRILQRSVAQRIPAVERQTLINRQVVRLPWLVQRRPAVRVRCPQFWKRVALRRPLYRWQTSWLRHLHRHRRISATGSVAHRPITPSWEGRAPRRTYVFSEGHSSNERSRQRYGRGIPGQGGRNNGIGGHANQRRDVEE